jgi:hypothetical protein
MLLTAERLTELRRLRTELPYYAEKCLKIRTKAGSIEPLRLNRAQRHVHEKLEYQRQQTGKVRALILKARQQGFSTYIGARFYHRASLNRGASVFILTHEQDATDNLFGMVDRYHKHCPLKPSAGAANAKELYFDRLDSGYSVGTAGTKATGRSKTTQLFHGSEVAFWPNAPLHFAGVIQTIPDLPGTEVVLESTANGVGGEFHKRWQQAEAGEGDYQAIFVPWFWSEEYRKAVPDGFTLTDEEDEYRGLYELTNEQMAWRRAKLSELGDPLLFCQEYPATATEAFQTTGHDSFIPAQSVARARKAKLEPIGPLILGVDPKREGSDRFSIAKRRGRVVLSVESDASPIGTLEAASKIKTIIDAEQPAKVFIDVGGNGGAIRDVLHSWGYGSVVKEVNFGAGPLETVRFMSDGSKRPGPKNRRAEMWEKSRDWLEEPGGASIPDSDIIHADACGPGYSYDTQQRLVLESKEHMASRGIRSPDEWDAVALTFAEPVIERRTTYRPRRSVGETWMAA